LDTETSVIAEPYACSSNKNDAVLASETVALVCKASADSFRVEILKVLQQDSFGVLELSDIFGVRQSAMSHHLKILVQAGLLEHKRQANSNFYRRAVLVSDDLLLELKQQIFMAIDATELSHDLAQAMARVHHSRAQQSREFFNRHAGQFSEINDLIAGYEHYADIIKAVMEPLDLSSSSRAMEVGPGEGGFLAPLAAGFDQVYALDNSGPMLELARRYLPEQVTNVRFILGDTQSAIRDGLNVDFIAFNMVMHHNPSPEQLFGDSAELLNPGGYLLVTELCPHDQQWTMESCGDLWLGLPPESIQSWGQQAGLTHLQQVITGLRNGFQVQVQVFSKG
jgi:ubiquinone/menaquinone biosynthesis C-methylase UbiE/predicted transcriptional regulator